MRWRVRLSVFLVLAALVSTSLGWLGRQSLHTSVGLIQTFYANPDFQDSPKFSRQTTDVSLAFLTTDSTLPQRNFSTRWEGFLLVAGGETTVYAGGDDVVRVWVDDRMVLERSPARGMHTTAATLQLDKGAHPLRIEYVQYGGGMSLNVLAASVGRTPRPLAPESLFPQPPGASLAWGAAFVGWLLVAARASWTAVEAAAIVLWVAPLALTGLWRLYRSRWIPRTIDRVDRWTTAAFDRYSAVCFAAGAVLLVAWTAHARWGGLNPRSLWADDVWVAALTRISPIWTAMAVPSPSPPGFVAQLWIIHRLGGDPESSMQIVPFLSGLAGPLVLGVAVAGLTRSRALGLVAASLGLLNPYLAHYSVFVKQYAIDFFASALLLVLAVKMLRDGQDWMKTTVWTGVAAALVSIPSVFSSVPLVHLAALHGFRTPDGRRRLRWAVGFDLALGAIFVLLRGRSGGPLRQYWARDFLPTGSWAEASAFLASHGRSTIVEALPAVLAWAALLAALGLVWLLVRRESRWIGVMIVSVYGGLVAASALQFYPIGQEFRGRIDIFSYAPTIALVVSGVAALTRWLPFHSIVNTGIAVAAIVLAVRAPAPAEYLVLDHSELARDLDSGARPDDAVVLNGGGAYLAGYYTRWRPVTVENGSPQGFGIDFDRPHTLAFTGRMADPVTHASLKAFLARERPARLWFFTTRDDPTPVEALLKDHGCVEQTRQSSTVGTELISYRCEPNGARRAPASP